MGRRNRRRRPKNGGGIREEDEVDPVDCGHPSLRACAERTMATRRSFEATQRSSGRSQSAARRRRARGVGFGVEGKRERETTRERDGEDEDERDCVDLLLLASEGRRRASRRQGIDGGAMDTQQLGCLRGEGDLTGGADPSAAQGEVGLLGCCGLRLLRARERRRGEKLGCGPVVIFLTEAIFCFVQNS